MDTVVLFTEMNTSTKVIHARLQPDQISALRDEVYMYNTQIAKLGNGSAPSYCYIYSCDAHMYSDIANGRGYDQGKPRFESLHYISLADNHRFSLITEFDIGYTEVAKLRLLTRSEVIELISYRYDTNYCFSIGFEILPMTKRCLDL
jgi:hypothetical protein